MRVPTLAQLALLFFLGGTFLHFMIAGGRTLYTTDPENERGSLIGQVSFLITGTLVVWWLGAYVPIRPVNGVFAAGLLAVAIGLYEWARHTIWGRRFGYALGDHVPEALCKSGPYRFIRHPIYLSYMLAFLASAIALPHWLTAATLVSNVVLFSIAARSDERTIATSALAADYAAYRARAGMFWPRLSRSGIDRSTP